MVGSPQGQHQWGRYGPHDALRCGERPRHLRQEDRREAPPTGRNAANSLKAPRDAGSSVVMLDALELRCLAGYMARGTTVPTSRRSSTGTRSRAQTCTPRTLRRWGLSEMQQRLGSMPSSTAHGSSPSVSTPVPRAARTPSSRRGEEDAEAVPQEAPGARQADRQRNRSGASRGAGSRDLTVAAFRSATSTQQLNSLLQGAGFGVHEPPW